MSTATATNGAATAAVFKTIAGAGKVAGKVVDAAQSFGPSSFGPSFFGPWLDGAARAGDVLLTESKLLAIQTLDAFDSGVIAYLEFTKSVAGATRGLNGAVQLAAGNARMVAELAATCSSAARDLLTT